MAVAALIIWVITVGLGSFMVTVWRRHGGMGAGGVTHLPPARVFSHLGLAVVGLVLWIVFLGTGAELWAWLAVATLVLAAVLGGIMVRRWTVDGRLAMSNPAAVTADLAEQHIQRLPVVLHGVAAATTFVLALLAAAGVGG